MAELVLSNSSNPSLIEQQWKIILGIIILFSFVFDMIVLTKYSISYGIDGPYYDIQVRNIIQSGFPESNDPPLVYYYLTPFVLAFGSFLGIKIAMSLISSMIAVPSFLIANHLTQNHAGAKTISLLAAFLSVFNWFYLRMIEDFMQNLAGVFFLLFFVYYSIKSFEARFSNKADYMLMVLFFISSILTHLYVAALALSLLAIQLLAHFIVSYQNKSFTWREAKIILASLFFSASVIALLSWIYPPIVSTFSKLSSFLADLQDGSGLSAPGNDFSVFLTLPYLLGIVFLFKQFKASLTEPSKPRIFSSLTILGISAILLVLTLPFIPNEWLSRFVLLAFVPIALVVPLGLLEFERLSIKHLSLTPKQARKVMGALVLVFALSGFMSAYSFTATMGPSISEEQYNELLEIQEMMPTYVDPQGVVLSSSFEFKYWIEYTLEMTVISQNDVGSFSGTPIYVLSIISQSETVFSPSNPTSWNPLLPYPLNLANSSPERPGTQMPSRPQGPQPDAMGPTTGETIYRGAHLLLILLV